MIRFHVSSDEGQFSTAWMDEPNRLVAVEKVTALRKEHGPAARIQIERDHTVNINRPERFRFEIFVREGTLLVQDADGIRPRQVDGLKLQSRSFQADEREQVRQELIEKFPRAVLTEVKA